MSFLSDPALSKESHHVFSDEIFGIILQDFNEGKLGKICLEKVSDLIGEVEEETGESLPFQELEKGLKFKKYQHPSKSINITPSEGEFSGW